LRRATRQVDLIERKGEYTPTGGDRSRLGILGSGGARLKQANQAEIQCLKVWKPVTSRNSRWTGFLVAEMPLQIFTLFSRGETAFASVIGSIAWLNIRPV
jgi:hypothetical protein